MNKINKTIAGTAVVALIIGIGIGYLGANALRPSFSAQGMTRGNFSGANGANFAGARGGNAGGMLSGTVTSQDSGSITLNTRDGSSRIVLITPVTSFLKSVNGVASDISIDTTVIVSGTTNSDGSITAQSVQIRPAGSVPSGFPIQTTK